MQLHVVRCDADHDAKVSAAEFAACGADDSNAADNSAQHRASFRDADANGDGALELNELVRYQSLLEKIDKRKEVLELIEVADENLDGVLSPAEVQAGLLKLPKLHPYFREQAMHTEL